MQRFPRMNMHKSTTKASLTIIVILILSGTAMASLFRKNLDANQFQELITTLPTGTNTERVVTSININNMTLPIDLVDNVHFKSCKWKDINAHAKQFKHITFEDCDLSNVNLRGATLDDITFINCMLFNVVMNSVKATNMKFIDSRLTSADPNVQNSYRGISANELIFKHSELTDVNFFGSKAVFRFIESKLNHVSGIGLLPGSALYFNKTDASLIDFDQSSLTNIEVIDSTIGNSSSAGGGHIKNILVKNSELDFVISDNSDIESIEYINSGNVVIGGGKNNKTISVKDCPKGTRLINTGSVGFDLLEIDNCHSPTLTFVDSYGKTVAIKNSSFYNVDFRDSNIKHLILEDVKIIGRIKYSGTSVDKLTTMNLEFGKDIKVSNDDSNLKITPDRYVDK